MSQKITIDKSLAEQLKSLRLDCGFGVTELSKHFQLLGVDTTRECINKIEAGKHNVSPRQLWAYKEAFGIDYNTIFSFLDLKED